MNALSSGKGHRILCDAFRPLCSDTILQGINTRKQGSNPGGARFSAPILTGPGAHPASYTMGTGSFPGVKRPGRGVDHPPPSIAEVKERVELYLYSTSGPSWLVIGWTLEQARFLHADNTPVDNAELMAFWISRFESVWLLAAFALPRKTPISSVISASLNASERLPLDGFPWNLIFVTFMKVGAWGSTVVKALCY